MAPPADPDDGAPADGASLFLAVEGMHCATCESFVERRATGTPGVHRAEASYPAGIVKLTYDPGAVDPTTLPDRLSGMGYDARPVEREAEPDPEPVGRLLLGGLFGMMVMLWYVAFLYPAYLGLPADRLLFDVEGPAGRFLVGNVWVLATVVLGYTGYPLLRGAVVSLRAGQPNMDLLVALAAGTAYAYSVLAFLTGSVEVYFDVAVVIVLAVTVGNFYEGRLVRRAAGELADLAEQRVETARQRTPEGEVTVPVEALEPGDEVVVRAGERLPADGTVVEGTAAVDESLVTGESLPTRRTAGDEVLGGATVVEGGLVVAVAEGAGSTLDRLVELLWEVQSARPGAQRLADRLAGVFVPVVVGLAVLAAGWQLATGATVTGATLTGLAVLVVSCPCALGLATPLALAAGVRDALRAGVVVTDPSAFERAPDVDVVVLDKTGTLTTGRLAVLDVAGDEGALGSAAALEQFADHPLARAVVDRAPPTAAAVEDVEVWPGLGVTGVVDGVPAVVGHADLVDERGWSVPDDLRERYERAHEAGHVPAYVGRDGAVAAVVVGGDEPRPEWPEVVDALDASGRRVVVLTGDGPAAAAPFAHHPGVDEVRAEVPPEEKAAVVSALRETGTVAMVGDGSNDAGALAAADLGVAMGSGTRLAADAAAMVVTGDDLRAVPRAFALTAAARRRVRGNLAWAFVYNLVAVPLAVAGLINPLLAAGAMATSSLLVVANSARPLLDRGDDEPAPATATAGTSEEPSVAPG